MTEKFLESTADILKVGILNIHKAAIRCISIDVSSTHVAAGCEEGSVCKKLQVKIGKLQLEVYTRT